jgi:hypothetical protein
MAARTNEGNIGGLIKDLEKTIQESKVDLASIKTELEFIIDTIRDLSKIIRNGDGSSILTRVAVIEQSVKELKEYTAQDSKIGTESVTRIALIEQRLEYLGKLITNKYQKKDNGKVKEIKESGKWKLYAIIASGIITATASALAILLSLL